MTYALLCIRHQFTVLFNADEGHPRLFQMRDGQHFKKLKHLPDISCCAAAQTFTFACFSAPSLKLNSDMFQPRAFPPV